MRSIEEIIINRVALSVLDLENKSLMHGKMELELKEAVYEYFEKHILKIINSDMSYYAKFSTEDNRVKNICREIIENEEVFVERANELAELMNKHIQNSEKLDKEKGADIAVCLFEALDGKYIAILKLDYSLAYAHIMVGSEEEMSITMTADRKGLPTPTQKLAKAVIISNNENKILLTDRELDGWFCESYLNCTRIMDERIHTKILKDATEEFTRRTFKDNAQDAEELRQKLTTTLVNEDRFDVEDFSDRVFKTAEQKEEYKACLLSEGIKETTVNIDREWAEKKLKRKRLKVDKNIELYIDLEAYNDREKFEIRRNGDGTIDIVLKNIKNYTEK